MLAYANQYPGGRDPSIGREFKPAPGQRAVSPQKIERRERMRGFFEGKGNTAPRGEEDDDPLRPLRDPFEKDRYEKELIEKHRGSDVEQVAEICRKSKMIAGSQSNFRQVNYNKY